jgi:hypothetical protein
MGCGSFSKLNKVSAQQQDNPLELEPSHAPTSKQSDSQPQNNLPSTGCKSKPNTPAEGKKSNFTESDISGQHSQVDSVSYFEEKPDNAILQSKLISNHPRMANFLPIEQKSKDARPIVNLNQDIISPLPNKMFPSFKRDYANSPKIDSQKFLRYFSQKV